MSLIVTQYWNLFSQFHWLVHYIVTHDAFFFSFFILVFRQSVTIWNLSLCLLNRTFHRNTVKLFSLFLLSSTDLTTFHDFFEPSQYIQWSLLNFSPSFFSSLHIRIQMLVSWKGTGHAIFERPTWLYSQKRIRYVVVVDGVGASGELIKEICR